MAVGRPCARDASRNWCGRFFEGAPSGFFVEVGADKPRQESQTWHLEQLGWTGILIEPQPDLAEALRRDRSAKVVAVACLSPGNAGRPMRLHVAGALSSLDRDRMAPGAQPERIIEVAIRTLDDILLEAGAPSQFDFLVDRRRRSRAGSAQRFRCRRWRPGLDSARRSRRQLGQAPVLEERGLSSDPSLRKQRLVCSTRRAGRGRATRALGYRSQVLSGPAVPDRAQRLARSAPALAGTEAPGELAAGETDRVSRETLALFLARRLRRSRGRCR